VWREFPEKLFTSIRLSCRKEPRHTRYRSWCDQGGCLDRFGRIRRACLVNECAQVRFRFDLAGITTGFESGCDQWQHSSDRATLSRILATFELIG
jgi:hypothetical protein